MSPKRRYTLAMFAGRHHVEMPFGGRGHDSWIIRQAFSPAELQHLLTPMSTLAQLSAKSSQTRGALRVRQIAPGEGGGGGREELPPNGTHIAQSLERYDGVSPSLGALKVLAQGAGASLIGGPLNASLFTKPGEAPALGLIGHCDANGGFIAVVLAGTKQFEMQRTRYHHPFGDEATAGEHLKPYETGDPITVEISGGDMMYVASHVLHRVHNRAGFVQHLRLSYPFDRWLGGMKPLIERYRHNTQLQPETVERLDAIGDGLYRMPQTLLERNAQIDVMDALAHDLMRQDVLSPPFVYNPAERLAQPAAVFKAIQGELGRTETDGVAPTLL
jgi:hypothetical protein